MPSATAPYLVTADQGQASLLCPPTITHFTQEHLLPQTLTDKHQIFRLRIVKYAQRV